MKELNYFRERVHAVIDVDIVIIDMITYLVMKIKLTVFLLKST